MSNDPRLDGRVAVVTGGAGGIGSAIAIELARCGASVAVNHHGDSVKAEALVQVIHRRGGRAIAIEADVRDRSAIDEMMRIVSSSLGTTSILVNSAGTYPRIPWDDLDLQQWQAQIDTNLTAHFLCAKAFTQQLRQSGCGRLVNVGSVLSECGRVDLAAYIAAKSGLVGLTRALARELGPASVTVNCVCPGSIEVPAERNVVPDYNAMVERQLTRQCIKRRGQPNDVASLVAFLVSEGAGFISGQTIFVDGGWLLR